MDHESYMRRCIDLALKGAGNVSPNPMVGAVLVHNNRIIGEGWHERFGEPHAEPNCINSVKEEDRLLVPRSALYVSLEPCTHYGKTPPCTDLIIAKGIPEVIIGCRDPFEIVNGKGIEKLKRAGTHVVEGILERECRELNRRFFSFHSLKRPYVILKWTSTSDGYMGNAEGEKRLLITQDTSNRLVHRWRSEEDAILVGTNTALMDNPRLTTRLWPGKSPVRMVVDRELSLPPSLSIFNNDGVPVVVFNKLRQGMEGNLHYYRVNGEESLVSQIMKALAHLNILSVIIEGGAKMLASFISEGLWDEARVITNSRLEAGKGIRAPVMAVEQLAGETMLGSDLVQTFLNRPLPDHRP